MREYEFIRNSCVRTTFKGRDLSGALFWGCDLRLADFTGADLTNAKIIACDIRGTNFSNIKYDIVNMVDMSGSLAGPVKVKKNQDAYEEVCQKQLAQSREKFKLEDYT